VRWRAIALHTPTLWKDIFIQGNLITASELVEAYLERSRDCLLDIDLDLDNCMTAEAWADRIDDQLDMVVEHVGRWRYLAVHGTWRESFLNFASRIHASCAPFLESIVIVWNVPYQGVDDRIDTCANIFTGGIPRLSSFFLSKVNLALFLPPLSSITSFTLGHDPQNVPVPFRIFHYALTQMPLSCASFSLRSITLITQTTGHQSNCDH
jgi:hypothetical protein